MRSRIWMSLPWLLCVCGGFILSCAVAVVCIEWASTPLPTLRSASRDEVIARWPQVTALPKLPKNTRIKRGDGVGTLLVACELDDCGYFSAGNRDGSRRDAVVAERQFLSGAGWPRLMFVTSEPLLANRRGARFAKWNPQVLTVETNASLPLAHTQVLWSGVAFNTMMFAAAIAAIVAWCRMRLGSMQRGIALLVIYGGFGWITSVTLSAFLLWRVWHVYPQLIADHGDGARVLEYSRDSFIAATGVPCPLPPARESWNAFHRRGIDGWGILAVEWDYLDTRRLYGSTALAGNCFATGWPLTNFQCVTSTGTRIEIGDLTQFQVRWLGMIVDAAVWSVPSAGVLWLGGWRSRRRRSQGQCVACGYPLTGAARCSECGLQVARLQSSHIST